MHWRRPRTRRSAAMLALNAVYARTRRLKTDKASSWRRIWRKDAETSRNKDGVVHFAGQWKRGSSTRSIDQPHPLKTDSDNCKMCWWFSACIRKGTIDCLLKFCPHLRTRWDTTWRDVFLYGTIFKKSFLKRHEPSVRHIVWTVWLWLLPSFRW